MPVFKYDKTREVEYFAGSYVVPCLDENGKQINLVMSDEDMEDIMQLGELFITEQCDQVKH